MSHQLTWYFGWKTNKAKQLKLMHLILDQVFLKNQKYGFSTPCLWCYRPSIFPWACYYCLNTTESTPQKWMSLILLGKQNITLLIGMPFFSNWYYIFKYVCKGERYFKCRSYICVSYIYLKKSQEEEIYVLSSSLIV